MPTRLLLLGRQEGMLGLGGWNWLSQGHSGSSVENAGPVLLAPVQPVPQCLSAKVGSPLHIASCSELGIHLEPAVVLRAPLCSPLSGSFSSHNSLSTWKSPTATKGHSLGAPQTTVFCAEQALERCF